MLKERVASAFTGGRGKWVAAPAALAMFATIGLIPGAARASADPGSIPLSPAFYAGQVADVTAASALTSAKGIAAAGDSVFVAEGSRIVRVLKNTGAVIPLAGADTGAAGCADASTGNAARFTKDGTLRVIGADGGVVYAQDSCGVRRIDIATGATSTYAGSTSFYPASYHDGHVYAISSYYGGVAQLDLRSGAGSLVTGDLPLSMTDSVAADDDAIWVIRPNQLYRYDRQNKSVLRISGNLPSAWVLGQRTTLSLGHFLYTTGISSPSRAAHSTLVRISKIDGRTELLAGDGAVSGNSWIYDVTGIATDGAKLYIADSSRAGAWVKSITSGSTRASASTPAGPLMNSGLVTTVTAPLSLPWASGLAVIGDSLYTADARRILRIGKRNGIVAEVAGSATESACVDAPTGGNARFTSGTRYTQLRVIGTDGKSVYAQDECGIHRVDPETGGTFTYPDTRNMYGATLTGHYIYSFGGYWGGLTRYDLQTGVTTMLTAEFPITEGNFLAADSEAVWGVWMNVLYRYDVSTGVVSRRETEIAGTPEAFLSVGDSLYFASRAHSGGLPTLLTRFDKSAGTVTSVAGDVYQNRPGYDFPYVYGGVAGHADGLRDKARFAGLISLASDGTDLYALDVSAQSDGRGSAIRRISDSKLPPQDAAPDVVESWWSGLRPDVREDVITLLPDRLGWLDGVPVAVRDRANRIAMDRAQADMQVQVDAIAARIAHIDSMIASGRAGELYPNHPDPVAMGQSEMLRLGAEKDKAEIPLKGTKVVRARIDAGPSVGPPAYLLGYSNVGSGRIILSIGNPESTSNIVTYVPGTFASLGPGISSDISRVEKSAADGQGVASAILWLGYDAPQSLLGDAWKADFAEVAAPSLRRFQDGLRRNRSSLPSARQIVIGHSYGTTVIGYAAVHGIDADELILVASPGLGFGVDVVDSLRLRGEVDPRKHVWATTAYNDLIRGAVAPHGTQPIEPRFGARIFSSDPGPVLPVMAAHSTYWDDGNLARIGMAVIINGTYGETVTAN